MSKEIIDVKIIVSKATLDPVKAALDKEFPNMFGAFTNAHGKGRKGELEAKGEYEATDSWTAELDLSRRLRNAFADIEHKYASQETTSETAYKNASFTCKIV
jgi:nitrogen regulatory protein PII